MNPFFDTIIASPDTIIPSLDTKNAPFDRPIASSRAIHPSFARWNARLETNIRQPEALIRRHRRLIPRLDPFFMHFCVNFDTSMRVYALRGENRPPDGSQRTVRAEILSRSVRFRTLRVPDRRRDRKNGRPDRIIRPDDRIIRHRDTIFHSNARDLCIVMHPTGGMASFYASPLG